MLLWFCETCGRRITDADAQAGRAKNKQAKGMFCSRCAAGVQTLSFTAVQNSDVPPNPAPTGRTPPKGTPHDRSSRSTPPGGSRTVQSPRSTHSASARTTLYLSGVSIGGMLGLLLLLVSTTSAGAKKIAAEPKPVALSKTISHGRTTFPVALPPEPASAKAPEPPAAAPAERSDVAASPEDDPRESYAARRLEEAKAFLQKNPNSISEYRDKLTELATTYRTTAPGKAAIELLANLKIPEAQLAPTEPEATPAMPAPISTSVVAADDKPEAPVAVNEPRAKAEPAKPKAEPRADQKELHFVEAESGRASNGWSINERPGFSGGKVFEIYQEKDPDRNGYWVEVKINAPTDGRYEVLLAGTMHGVSAKYTSPFTWNFDGGQEYLADRDFPSLKDVPGFQDPVAIMGVVDLKKGEHTFRMKLLRRREKPDRKWSLWFDALGLRAK